MASYADLKPGSNASTSDATAANQEDQITLATTANAELVNIGNDITNILAFISSIYDIDVDLITSLGLINDPAVTNPASDASLISIDKGILTRVNTLATASASQATASNQTTGNASLAILAAFATNSDTFTTAVGGNSQDAHLSPKSTFTITSIKTGAITSYTINLEGSMDNSNWFTLGTVTGVSAATQTTFVSGRPVLYYRATCQAIVLGAGTNVITTILAMK